MMDSGVLKFLSSPDNLKSKGKMPNVPQTRPVVIRNKFDCLFQKLLKKTPKSHKSLFDLFEEMIDSEKKGRKGEGYAAKWIYREILD